MSKLQPKLFTTLKNYSKDQFLKDVTAGIIVAIIALPLSIALAIASGVSPEKGLITAIIAGFIISLLGGSRVQIGGPTGAFMVIVYGIVIEYGLDGLVIATIMGGIIMILMGLMKLGTVIKYIPFPIITGFTSGIAIVIFASQIKDFFGFDIGEVPTDFIPKMHLYITSINKIDYYTLGVGVLALLIIIFWPKVTQKVPGALVALIVTSAIVAIFNLEVATIGTKFGELSSSIPAPSVPGVTLGKIKVLLAPAFTIAILGSIESLLSAVVSDGMIGGKHRSNMELIAQGTANIATGIFGGIPATGAVARTVANIKNGGRTPVAGIVHAITLLAIMLLFIPLAKMIPLTSLAAVLIIVAYNMCGWRDFKTLLKSPKSDVIVLVSTFLITVLIDLVLAIEIGMVLASFLFMKRMADVADVSIKEMDAAEDEDDPEFSFIKANKEITVSDYVQIYEINGPFFFGAADKFINTFKQISSKTNVLIVRMRNVPVMDATALHAFRSMYQICKAKNIHIIISGINPQPMIALKKAQIYELIGSDNFFMNVEEAIDFATHTEY